MFNRAQANLSMMNDVPVYYFGHLSASTAAFVMSRLIALQLLIASAASALAGKVYVAGIVILATASSVFSVVPGRVYLRLFEITCAATFTMRRLIDMTLRVVSMSSLSAFIASVVFYAREQFIGLRVAIKNAEARTVIADSALRSAVADAKTNTSLADTQQRSAVAS